MTVQPIDLLALAPISLSLGASLWVFIFQPLGLIKTMPRPQFIGLQMRLARHWSRVMFGLAVPTTVATLLGRSSHAEHVPALLALVAAFVQWRWVLPRALQAGGESLRVDAAHDLDAASFISEGGGAATQRWHRLVLTFLLLYFGGLLWTAFNILRP